jgi:stage III sporulation protein AE
MGTRWRTRAAVLAATAWLVAACPGPAAAATPVPPSVQAAAFDELRGLDLGPVQAFVEALERELGPGSGFGWQDLQGFLRGEGLLRDPGRLVAALWGVFAGALAASVRTLGQLLVLVVFAGVLRHVQSAFAAEAVGRVADAAVFLALGAVCLTGFGLATHVGRGAVDQLASFLVALLPALVGLLAATGAPATAGLLHPALVAAVNAVAVVVQRVVFPVLLLAAVLDLVSALTPEFRLTSLAGLLRQVGVGLLGLLLTVFLGVVAVQGFAGAVADGVALRAAKYAAKAFVPVVGGLLADAAEIVLSSGFLLRSGIGLFGLVAVALLALVPVLKMLALWAVYRMAAAAAQPVGGETVSAMLGGVASTLALLATAVAAVGLAAFLCLAAFVGAGGMALALRGGG